MASRPAGPSREADDSPSDSRDTMSQSGGISNRRRGLGGAAGRPSLGGASSSRGTSAVSRAATGGNARSTAGGWVHRTEGGREEEKRKVESRGGARE